MKKYSSTKRYEGETWEHAGIVLSPLNREYGPIVIPPQDAADFRIIAEFVGVLRSRA